MINKLKKNIINKIEQWSNKRKSTTYLLRFIKQFIKRILYSNAFAPTFMAYYLLLSFIPMTIFLSQILGMINESFDDLLFKSLAFLPTNVGDVIKPLLENMIEIRTTGLSILAAISWLWLGSRGFEGLIKMLNEIFDTENKPNIIFSKILSIIYLLAFVIICAGLLLFTVFDDVIVNTITKYTPIDELFPSLLNLSVNVIGKIIPIIFMIVVFGLLFKFSPQTSKEKTVSFKTALIGSTFTSIGIILITLIYAFTQNNLSKTNIYYGSLGGILALLVWILMICQAIVYGAHICATIVDMKNINIK